MDEIKLGEYYSAGYFLIRKNTRPSWLDEPEGLIPDEIISLESEFCPKFNLGWAWDSDDQILALSFGIDEAKCPEFEQWCTHHHEHDIDVWSMFHSTHAIRQFVNLFIPRSKWDGLTIIGAGLHQSCIDDWKEPYGTEGVEMRILQELPMEKGGQILGFDIASYAHHNFDHTWFSHGHHRGVFEEFGIRLIKYGLLQTREDALLARQYTDAHDSYGYEYWLLVSYPLEINESASE